MPLRKPVPSLFKLALRSLSEIMEVMAIKVMKRDRDLPPDVLRSALAEAEHYIWLSTPRALHDEIFAVFSKTLSRSFVDYDEESQVDATATILSVLTPSTLSTYRLEVSWLYDPDDVAPTLNNLHRLKRVKCLDLKDLIAESSPRIDDLMATGLSGMSSLTTISLGCCYTEAIVKALGENCPNLTTMVSNAGEACEAVTRSMVLSLLKLRRLRTMDIRVWCDELPFVILLLGLKELRDINPHCTRVCGALRFINGKRSAQRPFKLESVGEYYITMTKDLRILAKMCPGLTELNMTLYRAREWDRARLTPLPNLTVLRIDCPGYYFIPVGLILKALGSGLTMLKLSSRIGFDFNGIKQFCPNLKNLQLRGLDLEQEWNALNMNSSSFRSLEILGVQGRFVLSIIEPLLLNIVNVKVLNIETDHYFDEETVLRIFARNPMAELREISLSSRHNLSMRTVRTLMENCENLERIIGVTSWHRITWREWEDFRKELKINNIKLDIDSQRKNLD